MSFWIGRPWFLFAILWVLVMGAAAIVMALIKTREILGCSWLSVFALHGSFCVLAWLLSWGLSWAVEHLLL